MVQIVKNAEAHLDYEDLRLKAQAHRKRSISSAIGYSSVATAMNIGAKAIITPTASGSTARVVSKFKPQAMIIGVTPNESTLRRLQIFRGVYPIKSIPCETTEEVCDEAIELAKVKGLVDPGDIVIVTAGIPSTTVKNVNEGMSNMMRIAVVH